MGSETNEQSGSTMRFSWVWKPLATAVIIGMVAMGAVLYFSTGAETLERLRGYDWRFTAVCFVLVFIAWCCNGFRMKILSGSLGYPILFRRALQISLSTEFAIGATPAGSGSIVVRVLLLRRLGVPAGSALSMLATDGTLDFLFFIVISPLIVWPAIKAGFQLDIGTLAVIAAALCAIVLAVGLWFFFRRSGIRMPTLFPNRSLSELPRWRRRLRARRRLLRHRLQHSVIEFKQGLHTLMMLRPVTLLAVFCFCAVQWCCRYGILAVLLWGFGHPVNPLPLFYIQGLLFAGSLLFVVPGGSGGVEVGFAALMSPFIPKSLLGVSLILWRFFTYYLYLIGGAIAFSAVPFTFPKKTVGDKGGKEKEQQ